MDDEYQERYEQLLEEKKKVELEFGLARRRFKELYVGCENQLNNEKETSRQLEIQVKELTRQIDAIKAENEGIRIAAKISEEAKHEEFMNIRTKHDEEIASMQHIWKEASYDNQNRLVKEFEEERKKLLDANSKLEQKIRQTEEINVANQGRGNANSSDGIVSMMSNAFIRKPAHQNLKGDAASLENTQQQVQKNIDAWKSIVEPLEMEIVNLKKQLAEANAHSLKQSGSAGKKSDKEFMLNEELKEAQKYFESEKSARTDLEMYVAVLNTQKTVLQEDSDKLKRELHNVCRLFEQEKMTHNELKQTWKLANEQFLMQQQKLIVELELTKKLMSPSQLEQLSRTKYSDTSNAIRTVAEHPYQVSTVKPDSSQHNDNDDTDTQSTDNLIDFDCGEFSQPEKQSLPTDTLAANEPTNQNQKNKLKEEIFSTFFPAAYQAQQFNEMLSADTNIKEQPLILSSSSDSEDDDLEQAIRIQNLNRYAADAAEEDGNDSTQDAMFSKTNPVAMLEDFDNEMTITKSSSTDMLHPVGTEPLSSVEKSLSQGDVSWSSNNMDLLSQDNKSDAPSASAEESIWNNVSVEYAHTCMMCQNYEKQLQRLQKDYMTIKERDQNQLDSIKSIQSQLNSEKESVASLEKSIETVSSDNRTQICIYEKNQQEVDKQVLLLQDQFQEFQMNILKEMKSLISDTIDDV